MTTKDQELLEKIKEAELARNEAYQQMTFHKKAWVEAETRLISASILKDKLIEELRVFHATSVNEDTSQRDKEIEEFRLKLPELLEKIK